MSSASFMADTDLRSPSSSSASTEPVRQEDVKEMDLACEETISNAATEVPEISGLPPIPPPRRKTRSYQSWSTEETHALVRMVHEKRSWGDIAAAFQRERQACYSKYMRTMNRPPPYLPGLRPKELRRAAAAAGVAAATAAAAGGRHKRLHEPAEITPPQPAAESPHPEYEPVPEAVAAVAAAAVAAVAAAPVAVAPVVPSGKDQQQQFVAHVHNFATRMCAKLDPKTLQMCNAMFQFLLTVLPDSSESVV
jgi:hypothetical protein